MSDYVICFRCGEKSHKYDTTTVEPIDGFTGKGMPEKVTLCCTCVGFIIRGWVLSERLLVNIATYNKNQKSF